MKTGIITFTLLCLSFTFSSGQNAIEWKNWNWLIGSWTGQGSGQPGQGEGTFSFSFELDSNVLVRKSHSSYPATTNKPETFHNDLMIIYKDNGVPSKAAYFDNEGHIIHYKVVSTPDSIVFTSEKLQNMPVFRLTYTLLENGIVNTKFEMSQDGQKFMTYIEGKSKRVR